MADLITIDDAGRIIVGLDAEWNPVPIADAVLVKMTEPDGTVRFLRPKKTEGAAS